MTAFDEALIDIVIGLYTTATVGFIVLSIMFCIFMKESD